MGNTSTGNADDLPTILGSFKKSPTLRKAHFYLFQRLDLDPTRIKDCVYQPKLRPVAYCCDCSEIVRLFRDKINTCSRKLLLLGGKGIAATPTPVFPWPPHPPQPQLYMQSAIRPPHGSVYMKPNPQLLITSQPAQPQPVKRPRSPSPTRSGIPAVYYRNALHSGPSSSRYPVTTAYSSVPTTAHSHYTSYPGKKIFRIPNFWLGFWFQSSGFPWI